MSDASFIGIDLEQQHFQIYGVCSDGSVIFRTRLSRSQRISFLEKKPQCMIALEM